MSLSISSANSDISRPAIFRDTALTKVVLSPNKKQVRNPELELIEDTMTCATCGTKEDVKRKHLGVSTDTSVGSVEAHTARPTALEGRSEVLKSRGDRPRYARQLI
jgi:hypothetical protein